MPEKRGTDERAPGKQAPGKRTVTLTGVEETPELLMLESISDPPRPVRAQLPTRDRYLLRLADPVLSKTLKLSLFQAAPPA